MGLGLMLEGLTGGYDEVYVVFKEFEYGLIDFFCEGHGFFWGLISNKIRFLLYFWFFLGIFGVDLVEIVRKFE